MEIKGNRPIGEPRPGVVLEGSPKAVGVKTATDAVGPAAVQSAAEVAATLPPPSAPAVALSEAALRGAESFAAQLETVGQTPISSDDLTAAFLKLQVGTDRQECDYTETLALVKHLLAKLAISNARQMDRLLGSNSEVQAVLRAILGQLERDLAKAFAKLEELQRKTLEQKAEKREDRDDKAVGEEERARKLGKSSLKAMSAAAGAEVSSAVATADPSGTATTVAGLVTRLVAGSHDLAGRRL